MKTAFHDIMTTRSESATIHVQGWQISSLARRFDAGGVPVLVLANQSQERGGPKEEVVVRSEHVFSGPGLKVGASAGALAIIGNVMLHALPHFRPEEFPLGVAVQFGVALTIVGLQWDIFAIVKATTEKRNRANRLMAALEVSDLHEEQLVNLCEAAAQISGKSELPRFVVEDVEATIAWVARDLGELLDNRQLNLNSASRLMHYLRKLSVECKGSILATSAIEGVDSTFWDSDEGRAYLSIQSQKKSQVGTLLRRIFLVARQHDLDDTASKRGLLSIISAHEAAGFEVGVLYDTRLDDFVVFNEQVVVYSDRGTQGEAAERGRVDFDKNRAKARADDYLGTWPVAAENRKNLSAESRRAH